MRLRDIKKKTIRSIGVGSMLSRGEFVSVGVDNISFAIKATTKDTEFVLDLIKRKLVQSNRFYNKFKEREIFFSEQTNEIDYD